MIEYIDKYLIECLETNEVVKYESFNCGYIEIIPTNDESLFYFKIEVMSDNLKSRIGSISFIVNDLYSLNFKYKVYELLEGRSTDDMTKILIRKYVDPKERLLNYLKLILKR